MKYRDHEDVSQQIVDLLRKASVLGAQQTVDDRMEGALASAERDRMVARGLANGLSAEMMEQAVVDRALVKTPRDMPWDGAAVEYRVELVVMSREDWKRLNDLIVFLTRKVEHAERLRLVE